MASDSEDAVQSAFAAQAVWCRRLGSAFTGQLCETIGARLGRETVLGRRVLDWQADPDARHDALPLRLCGGLHALVRAGQLPDLAPLYPPAPMPDADRLWQALRAAFVDREADLLGWLDLPPQTNEVARSAVLIAGLAVVAARTGLPLDLYELGASAGLNLLLDHYESRVGSRVLGCPGSPVRLAPDWTGPAPPEADLRVAGRRGVDRKPLDVRQPRDRERLTAYVWADQAERLRRLEAALALAAADPPSLERADAAEWVERQIAPAGPHGVARVVMHSIAFQYFPTETQDRVSAHLTRVGQSATVGSPLAWLRYEAEPEGAPSLRLRLWPDGGDDLLARADPHGRWVSWCG